MSISLGANGASYSYPESGDPAGWGSNATNFASAVSAALTKLGLGSSLTADAVINIASTVKGILIPKMTTTQRDAIASPSTGLLIYNTTTNLFNVYYSSAWHAVLGEASIIDNLLSTSATSALSANQGYILSGMISGSGTGVLNGGLVFNSTLLPPKIIAGAYNVSGTNVSVSSDTALTLTNVIGDSRQALDTYSQYLVAMNSSGTKVYLNYGEGAVTGATGNITSIAESPSGTYTLTKSTGTIGAYTDKTLVITNGATTIYIGKITGGNGSSTVTFKAPAGLTFSTSGTYTVYDRINTLHGAGSATAITTDANVIKYSPSYGENGWSSGIAAFDTAKNGFYLTLLGLTDYRVIGNFRTDGSSLVLTNVISHKTGRNKNDNFLTFRGGAPSGYGATDTYIIRWDSTKLHTIFGCDYTYLDSANNATKIQINRNGKMDFGYNAASSGGQLSLGVTINSTQLTTSVASISDGSCIGMNTGIAGEMTTIHCNQLVCVNDIVRCHANTNGFGASAASALNFKMEL